METRTLDRAAAELPGLSAATFCEAFQRSAAEGADRVALRTPGGAVEITWREYARRVRLLAAGLAALGVGRGDTAGIMLANRPEFHLVDVAALHLGAVPFSIYNTSSPEQIEYLFSNAGNRVVVTESQFVDAVLAARERTAVEHVVCIDGNPGETIALADVEAGGDDGFDFEGAWRAVDPDDVVTIIYTSGTTGPPKGVELTHASVIWAWRAAAQVLPIRSGERLTSYLPSAHAADRFIAHWCSLLCAATITSVPDPRQAVAALTEARPTVWGAVPRIWEKLKAALEAGFAAEPDERRAAIETAIELGLEIVRAEQAGAPIAVELREQHAQLDAAVLSKIRERLGLDQARWLICGAAPTPVEVLEFFAALGLPICEVWGMSETSALGTVNPPERIKIGTVGRPIPGVELRLADDGELLYGAPNLMKGYRGDPETTAEAIDSDGWLHTGDVATIDADGYVTIVDRKKELIINAAGKNMSPANIEARLKTSSPLIGQAICVGDGRPYNVALLVLDPDGAAAYARELGLADCSPAALSRDTGVREAVAAAVEEANSHLSRVEQVKRFTVLPADWEPGGDELTPTMKLKRGPIERKYAREIEELYA